MESYKRDINVKVLLIIVPIKSEILARTWLLQIPIQFKKLNGSDCFISGLIFQGNWLDRDEGNPAVNASRL